MRRLMRIGPIRSKNDIIYTLVPLCFRHAVLLHNPKEKQAVFLKPNGSNKFDAVSADILLSETQRWKLPEHGPALSDAWFSDAEFVVLSCEDDEPVTLPVEFTLKVPKQK